MPLPRAVGALDGIERERPNRVAQASACGSSFLQGLTPTARSLCYFETFFRLTVTFDFFFTTVATDLAGRICSAARQRYQLPIDR